MLKTYKLKNMLDYRTIIQLKTGYYETKDYVLPPNSEYIIFVYEQPTHESGNVVSWEYIMQPNDVINMPEILTWSDSYDND